MASKKQELTEKLGLKYFRKLENANNFQTFDNQVHFLDEKERQEVFKIGRQTIINAFLIGAISSAITTYILFKYGRNLISIKDYLDKSNLNVLIIIGVSSLLTTLFEMIFLFFEGLRKSHKITKAAHLELFPDEDKETFIAKSIVRAALELPNPKKSDIKIDPKKEREKSKAIFKNFFYKTKASLSVVIMKQILKKVLGKAIGRAYLSIISIPLMGFWNAYESRQLIKEVKIRVLGPSAVSEFVENYKIIKKNISYKAELQILRAVASCIISTETLHPNLEFLFKTLKNQFEINTRNSILDNTSIFLERLNELPNEEQKFILYVLEFAAIIDGKITRKEKDLLHKAFQKCGYGYRFYKTKASLKRFVKGDIINWNDKLLSNIY